MFGRGRIARMALACVVVVGGVSFAAPSVLAKAPKAPKSGKGQAAKEVSGTVQTISRTEITLLVDGDKTKIKVFLIDDKTQITGDVVRGGNATVTPGANNKAKSISAS